MTESLFRQNIQNQKSNFMRSILTSSINNKLDMFEEYIQKIESTFNVDIKNVTDYASNIDQIQNSEEKYWMKEMISDELSKIDDMLGENFRYSVLVSLYSFLEHQMTALFLVCHHKSALNVIAS